MLLKHLLLMRLVQVGVKDMQKLVLMMLKHLLLMRLVQVGVKDMQTIMLLDCLL